MGTSNNTGEYIKLGDKLRREQKPLEAITAYQQALNLEPDNSIVYALLGTVQKDNGDLTSAISNFQKAIDINLQPPAWFYTSLGSTQQRLEKYEQAIKSYYQAIEIVSEIPFWVYQSLGNVLSQQQRWDEAIKTYQQAKKLQPDNVEIDRKLEQLQLEKTKEANLAKAEDKNKVNLVKDRIKISKIESENYQVCLDSADELARQGKVDIAIIGYLQAIKARPEFHEPYFRLTNLFLHNDSYISAVTSSDLSEVIQVCKDLIQAEYNDNEVYFLLGRSFTEQGKIEKAKECYQKKIYRKTLKIEPNYAKNHWNSGRLKGPDFMIIGAPKCGTTTLYNYMNQHPQILEAISKEIKYFSTRLSEQKNDYYFAHFPPTPEDKSFITGEATPGSIYNRRNAAKKIFDILPNIKLIVLLRNPVDRAISQYFHWQKLGIETRPLESIISSEQEKLQEVSEVTQEIFNQTKHGYITKGLYFFYLKQWLSIFPRKQILILKTEDFAQKPALIMNRVFEFLELPKHSSNYNERLNVGSYAPINTEMHRRLSQFFQPYNQQLEELLAMEFNWD